MKLQLTLIALLTVSFLAITSADTVASDEKALKEQSNFKPMVTLDKEC